MIQSVGSLGVSSHYNNVMFKSNTVNKSTVAPSSKQDRYVEYVKEFNEIPKKANRFFWGAQLIGTAMGALGGLISMTKGQILTSAKEATIVGAAAGWFLSFCIGLVKKADVVKKQNKLTEDYMKLEEKYMK